MELLNGCWQVEGRVVSEIGPGLLVLVGLHESDLEADADYMYVPSPPVPHRCTQKWQVTCHIVVETFPREAGR